MRQTCFVIGAGAHKPYGMPLGEELKSDIISKDACLIASYNRCKKIVSKLSEDEISEILDELKNHTGTIDSFMSKYEHDLFGNPDTIKVIFLKYSIIYHLKQKQSNQLDIVSWIENLRSICSDYDSFPIKIVTFNYDRLFQDKFSNSTSQNISYFHGDDLVHVYGSYSNMPFFKHC